MAKAKQLDPAVLRQRRRRNYRLKSAAGFTCDFDGCEVRDRLLVVRNVDGGLAVRCAVHRGEGDEPEPGQWHERLTGGDDEDEAA